MRLRRIVFRSSLSESNAGTPCKTIFCWHSHIMVLMPPENTEINHSLYGDLRATIIELLPLKFHFSSVCGQVQDY